MDPASSENLVICQWNDLDALNAAFEQSPGQIAAVIMEPLLINTNFIFPRDGYLEGVKEICQRNGALSHLRRGDHRVPGGPGRRAGTNGGRA